MKSKLFIRNSEKRFIQALRRYPLQTMSAGLTAFLFLAVLAVALLLPHGTKGQSPAVQNQAPPAGANDVSADTRPALAARSSYADTVEKVMPAVVAVRSEKKTTARAENSPLGDDPLLQQFFGGRSPQARQAPQIERGLGSGVIVEANGTILTNNHVVEGASQVKVDLPDKRTFNAKVVGTDAASDLAVLKIDAADLPTIRVGDSDRVRVGDVVLAIGNPLGLRQTVTSGIISAKGRQTGLSDGSFEDFLQTDAPINQGNSGGALVNLDGELVGINSQILSTGGGSIGLGFSIPSNMAKSVMAQLLKDGKVHRGQLGVGIQDVTSDLAKSFDLKEVRGVLVNSVTPGSPADKAGVKQGDVILSFNGANINDGNELRNRVAQTAPGSEAAVGVLRAGGEQTLKVTLGEFQPKTDAARGGDGDTSDADPTSGKLGLSLEPLTPQIARQLNLKEAASGLVVAGVQPGSPADEAGLAQGDVVLQINRQDVKSIGDVKTALAKTKDGSVLLLINRGGQTLFVTAAM